MTNNEILARWQGWKPKFMHGPRGKEQLNVMPNYPNDEAACGSLLDTLVEKGFAPRVEYDYEQDQWAAVIFKPVAMGADCILHRWKPTRREAIISVCLGVTRKGLDI